MFYHCSFQWLLYCNTRNNKYRLGSMHPLFDRQNCKPPIRNLLETFLIKILLNCKNIKAMKKSIILASFWVLMMYHFTRWKTFIYWFSYRNVCKVWITHLHHMTVCVYVLSVSWEQHFIIFGSLEAFDDLFSSGIFIKKLRMVSFLEKTNWNIMSSIFSLTRQ